MCAYTFGIFVGLHPHGFFQAGLSGENRTIQRQHITKQPKKKKRPTGGILIQFNLLSFTPSKANFPGRGGGPMPGGGGAPMAPGGGGGGPPIPGGGGGGAIPSMPGGGGGGGGPPPPPSSPRLPSPSS